MFDILLKWNRWGNDELNAGIEREITSELIPFLDTPEIVALIGARRAGKTTVLFQVMDILEKEGVSKKAMLHVNLEEPAFSSHLGYELLDKLYNLYRKEIFPEGKAYLFLDEIQNVPNWERWIRARNETEDVKFFITGSSSQLMSRELGTVLTGRHVSFQVYPLNFREFLRFKSISVPNPMHMKNFYPALENALSNYFLWGGFPEVVLAENEKRKEILLKQYFDDILFKDVVMRHNIRETFALRNIAVFLLTHTGSLISFQRIAKIFEVSVDLARSYCQYLQEAFVVDFVGFYSQKAAERQRNPHKVYAVDLGLRNAISLSSSEDKGHIIETAVYHALQQHANDGIFYWKQKGEVDFLLRKATTITNMFQVVEDGLDHPEIFKREIQSLNEAGNVFSHAKKMVIAKNLPKQLYEKNEINVISLLYFLLNNSK